MPLGLAGLRELIRIMVGFHWSMIGQPGLARTALRSNYEPTAVPSLPVVKKKSKDLKKKKGMLGGPVRSDTLITGMTRVCTDIVPHFKT
jgi:hypothetical protein